MALAVNILSLISLGVLTGFVVSIIAAIAYFLGYLSMQFVIFLIIAINFISWLVGPYIQTFMFKIFYKIDFYDYEQIKDKKWAQFVKKISDERNIKVPKIGIIRDGNPTAFTYGSASFNARVVLSEGIFKFLNEREIEAVLAHEMGHIANKDFIIMSIASTLLNVLYVIARGLTKVSSKGRKAGRKGGDGRAIAAIIGLVAYVLYYIGTYILLFLSRTREYYADEFSAKVTKDPDALSSALIKIAYGISITPDTSKTAHLLNQTRTQGIYDHRRASEAGMAYSNTNGDIEKIKKAISFDFRNPWAFVSEISSTHPLIGKRIKRLSTMSNSSKFDFKQILSQPVDKARLWKNFLTDIFVTNLPGLVILGGIAYTIYMAVSNQVWIYGLVGTLIGFIITAFFKILYQYPRSKPQETTVIDCMADIYASPVRGKPVKLQGKAVGRGAAGLVFNEDLMFQDKSGIIFLNYQSLIPIFGNIFFGLKKVKKLMGVNAAASGWFVRGAAQRIELSKYITAEKTITSHVVTMKIIGTLILSIVFSLIVLFFFYL